ncbi:MAG: type II secretion system F family protein [Candidatus Rifleibacteriota bacterium]
MERIKVRYADEKGRSREEIFEIRSIAEMRKAFQAQGYYIISEEKEEITWSERFQKMFNVGQGASIKELNEFTKLLRTLIKSGMPINDAFDVLLEGAADTRLNRSLKQVKEDISEGIALSTALGRHPDVFPEIYIKTIVAGEKSGALENILLRLSEFFVSTMTIRRKVVAAMIYPCILLMVTIVAVSYMIVAVVPEFSAFFRSVNVPLPLMTTMLLWASDFLSEWFWVLVFGLILVVSAVWSYSKTIEGRKFLDNLKLAIPIIRDLETNYAFSQFSRTLSTMIEGGIPLLDSLNVVLETLENKVLATRFSVLPELLEKGLGFGKALKKVHGAPGVMVKVIHVGEESGNLGEMLDNLADHYDEEISETTEAITALIEPILFLGIAMVVGTMVVALLYPLLTASTHLN